MLKLTLFCMLLGMGLYAKSPTIDDMIAQMIVIGFDGQKEGDKWVEQIAKDIKREKIGGIVINDKNIHNASQLKKLSYYLKSQANSTLPLFVIAEEEGGDNALFSSQKGFKKIPSAKEMAEDKDIIEAQKMYQERSSELAEAGIGLNFGPVLDLQAQKAELSSRSYAAYEEIIITYATLFIDALSDKGIVSVVKYFPMAGKNLEDNFSAETRVNTQWRFAQLKPYYDLIAFKKVDAVVMSHALIQDLDKEKPALFSSLIIEGLLRGKLHFEGVVFADNLRTDSISNGIDFKSRVIRSIQAGVDVLVFPNYFGDNASMPFTVHKIITEAIRSGELSKERIALSYERIVKLKEKMREKPKNTVFLK